MTERPPQLRPENADVFQLESVARAYHHRPPYPVGVVDALLSLLGPGRGGAVLEAGCGTAELGRALVESVDRVDAVDVSAAMIEEGSRQERGDHPHLRWVCARLEEAQLQPPYALAVAAESLNWMDWDVALPRLHHALLPGAWLAIVQRQWGTGTPEEAELIRTYSVLQPYQPYELGRELATRGLYRGAGHLRFAGTWHPTIEEYVEARHSQAGFPRDRMGTERAAEFDREVAALLQRLVAEGRLPSRGDRLALKVVAEVGWGRPQPARPAASAGSA